MLPTSTAVAAGATAAVRPAGPSQCRQRQEDTVTTPPQLSTCRRLSTPLQRLQSREGEVTTFPTAAAASAIAITAALCPASLAARLYFTCVGTIHPCLNAWPTLLLQAVAMLCHGPGHGERLRRSCNSRRRHHWRCGAVAIINRSAAQQGRRRCINADQGLRTDAQKVITQRRETVETKRMASVETTLTMLVGLIPASSLTSRRNFGRRFAELLKGEDQPLAWSGVEGGGSKWIK